MSQNGMAEVSVGWIAFGERSGYQRVRARCPGSTSRSNTPRVRASDTQVAFERHHQRFEFGHDALARTGSDLSRSCSWNQ